MIYQARITGKLLSPQSAEQKSAILLSNAIMELIDNSIDANAENILVKIDPWALTISVHDDGKGMDLDGIHKFWQYGNDLERGTIGSWGLGAKYAWASLVAQNEESTLAILTKHKNADGVIGCYQSFQDLTTENLTLFSAEPVKANKLGTGTSIVFTKISKKFRKFIIEDPTRFANVFGMFYKSTLQRGKCQIKVEIVNDSASSMACTNYEVLPFDLDKVSESGSMHKVYNLSSDRSIHMSAYKVNEEQRSRVKAALAKDECSGVFAEYRGRILTQINLKHKLTITNGLIIICTLDGHWVTNPNKSKSMQGDGNDEIVAAIMDDLKLWVEKNIENTASLKTNIKAASLLNQMLDRSKVNCDDCNDGNDCQATYVPKIDRKGNTTLPGDKNKDKADIKKSTGKKEKKDNYRQVVLTRAKLGDRSLFSWSLNSGILTVTICSTLYKNSNLDSLTENSPFYAHLIEAFSRYVHWESLGEEDRNLFSPSAQGEIPAEIKQKMLDVKNGKTILENANASPPMQLP